MNWIFSHLFLRLCLQFMTLSLNALLVSLPVLMKIQISFFVLLLLRLMSDAPCFILEISSSFLYLVIFFIILFARVITFFSFTHFAVSTIFLLSAIVELRTANQFNYFNYFTYTHSLTFTWIFIFLIIISPTFILKLFMHFITACEEEKIKLQQNYCCYRLEMQFTINCRFIGKERERLVVYAKILIKLKCNWQCTASNIFFISIILYSYAKLFSTQFSIFHSTKISFRQLTIGKR